MKFWLWALCLSAVSCADPGPAVQPTDLGHHSDHAEVLGRSALQARFVEDRARFTRSQPFRQVGLRIDGAVQNLQWRALVDGRWTAFESVPLTWSEGRLHVGRILLTQPTTHIELSGGLALDGLSIQTWTKPQVRKDKVLTRDLPLATLRQNLAPRDLVIPRADWGARNPGNICNEVVAPYRISIHHTASPSDDGGDAAIRMRQMQAYHMDNRGWCDIGYHFVVSKAGQVYQGRSDERRPGAHVGGQNTGNVGISIIGNFEESEVSDLQFNTVARILDWVRTAYDIPLDRDVIRGHREWPGQTTDCPGENMLSRLDEIVDLVRDGGGMPGERVSMRTEWATPPADIHTQGASDGVPDVFPGDRIQAVFRITNDNDDHPIRGVRLGYDFGPGLRPVSYTIYSDSPAYDRETWQINDANEAPENPADDALGGRGELVLYAFAAQEAKQVVVDLEVEPYTGVFRPGATGWVRHIDDIYDQAWDADPNPNTVGRRLEGLAVVDVLSPTAWSFPADESTDLEGWQSCAVGLSTRSGALVLPANGCAQSPSWTAVDADRWDSVVLRLSDVSGPTRFALWAEDEALTFAVDAPGDFVIPAETLLEWQGIVENLQLTMAGPPLAIDALYVQSSTRQEAQGGPYVNGSVVTLLAEEPPTVPDAALPDLGGGGGNGGGGGGGAGGRPSPDSGPSGPDVGTDPDLEGDEGCSQSTGGSGGGGWLLLLALGRWRFRHRRT